MYIHMYMYMYVLHYPTLTNTVLVNFNRSIVHLCHGLHLQVVAVAVIRALAVYVLLKILSHKLREVLSILQLIVDKHVVWD